MRTRQAGRVVLALTAATAVLAPQAPAQAAEPPRIDLRADVDRDGSVDLTGVTDEQGEDTWSVGRGALFLPNIDDDSRRCRPPAAATPDSALARCNDAADGQVNGSADAADLARVRSVAATGLSDDATGSVRVTTGNGHVRVFLKRAGAWTPVTTATRLTAQELRAGAEFGVEGKDVIRDSGVWDGRAVIRLTVTSGDGTSTDEVTLRAAPLLTHHNLQNTQRVLVTEVPGNDSYARSQQQFVKGLVRQVEAAGVTAPVVKFRQYGDVWAQDFVEPAYVGMTGPGGRPQTIRVMLRSAQDRPAGRELYSRLRGPGIGVVQARGRDMRGWETLNSFGNLETIPPYAQGGRSYPAGRIIMGRRESGNARPSREIRALLRSQGLQNPLLLDTSWLHVGHVDEFVQFLPADTPRGWRIGIADPQAGLELLRKAKREGHGGTRMFSVKAGNGMLPPQETIAQALASRHLVSDNTMAAERIRANLDILKRETGVTDDEIVRVPALYTRGIVGDSAGTRMPLLRRVGGTVGDGVRDHGQQGLLAREGAAAAPVVATSAYVPGAVNGILLARDRYLAPRQWGPVVGGKDIFTTAVTAAYRKAGIKVSYIDDWYTYHLGMGEVHCGTNTLRDTSAPWWGAPAAR
ncbi:protein-arginine deiminase domain-containing protein [Streptomyces sp. NPDC058739]|uniref:protein-arginine deiminase domain-containing protein n=1 Tax=Streptomyces sp. NPDC058739 TaxID=3346618 RepID=UPI0036BFA8CB